MHDHRVLRQFGVAGQGVLDFFLGRHALLPGGDGLLKQLGPQPIEIDLFARALVDDLEPVARLYGFLAPRVKEKYSIANPDSRSFERIGRALAEKNTERWQAEGASMNLEEAVALALNPGRARPCQPSISPRLSK